MPAEALKVVGTQQSGAMEEYESGTELQRRGNSRVHGPVTGHLHSVWSWVGPRGPVGVEHVKRRGDACWGQAGGEGRGGEGWGSAWGARVGRKGDKGGGWTRTRRAWGNGLGHWQLGSLREIGMLRGTGTHLDAA